MQMTTDITLPDFKYCQNKYLIIQNDNPCPKQVAHIQIYLYRNTVYLYYSDYNSMTELKFKKHFKSPYVSDYTLSLIKQLLTTLDIPIPDDLYSRSILTNTRLILSRYHNSDLFTCLDNLY